MTKTSMERPGWLVVGLVSMLFLSPVQDSFLQATPLNVAGASPAFLILLLIWLIFGAHALVSGSWLRRAIPVWLLAYSIAFMLLNIFYAVAFGFEAYGENLLIKGCKIGILLGALVSVAWLYSSYTLPRFSLIVRIAYGVALGGMVLDMIFHDFWIHNTWIHGSIILNTGFDFGKVDNRPHGFSSESSTLAITLATLGLLCASTALSKSTRWFWVTITFVSLLLVGSKAAPLLMLSSLVFAVFLMLARGGSTRQIFTIVCAGVFVVLSLPLWQTIFVSYVFDPFLYDVEAGMSVATRLTLWIGALMTVLKYPLGVGLSGYLPAVVQSIDQAGTYAEMLFSIPLNLSEVVGYTTQVTANAIGTKSLFLDCLIVFGIPFGIYWALAHMRLAKKLMHRGDVVPLSLLIMLAFALMSYIPGVGIYPIAIAYGWLFRRASGECLVPTSKSVL